MSDGWKFFLGTAATILVVLFLCFACVPGWEDASRRDCERQGGQYIYWNGEGHCYPAYTIPGTAPAYGR